MLAGALVGMQVLRRMCAWGEVRGWRSSSKSEIAADVRDYGLPLRGRDIAAHAHPVDIYDYLRAGRNRTAPMERDTSPEAVAVLQLSEQTVRASTPE